VLFWILVVLQMVTGIVAGEASIRKTSEGEAALKALSNAGFFFLRWRAYADYRKELMGLQRLFGIAAIIFSVMFFVLGKTGVSDPILAVFPGIFISLWVAMQFGTNFRRSVREQLKMISLLVMAPWGILLLDSLTEHQLHLLQLMARPLASLGVLQLPDWLIAAMLSGVGLVGGVVMVGFAIVAFSVVPMFFLFVMVATSVLSRRALLVSPQVAYNITSMYFYVVGPVFVALENKGVI